MTAIADLPFLVLAALILLGLLGWTFGGDDE